MTDCNESLRQVREKLARVIHERYVQDQQGSLPPEAPGMQPWERLREDLKESNRRQADQIAAKLAALGYGCQPAEGPRPALHRFSAEGVEILAQMEHERWRQEKLGVGWRYAPARDDARKLHPCLVSWDELPETEKDKDRRTVRRIPEYLALAGLKIVRR